MSIRIRMATTADAPKLLAIYTPYVTDTTISFEYQPPTLAEFTERIRKTLTRYPYLVAEREGEIVGYVYVSVFHGRAAYDWSVETSIYVDQNCRQSGIGKALYEVLEEVLTKQGIRNLNACITHPNPDSIAFHERMGYRMAAHFHQCGFKHGRWCDVVWMEKFLRPHDEAPAPITPVTELTLPQTWEK